MSNGDAEHALLIFGRAPVAGQTKTRLAPALGYEGAAALYRAFLRDVLERLGHAPHAALWVAGDPEHPALRELCPTALTRLPQPETDLGTRMSVALQRALTNTPRALLIGSDAPTLPAHILAEAVALLGDHDFVLTPSADGGFPLFGARAGAPLAGALSSGVRWSTRFALADTQRTLASRGRVALTSPWYDVDTPADLRLLSAELSLRPARAPHTARALRLATGGSTLINCETTSAPGTTDQP